MTNERRIIELLLDIIVREKIIDANVGFLTEQVNNANWRLIHIEHEIEEIESILQSGPQQQIADFTLSQRKGAVFMAINGVAVGATGTFQIGFVPPSGVPLPTPPTVTVDDANVTLGAVSTDGQFTFTAAVAAGDTAPSFNLTVSGTNAAGTALQHVFNVPILAVPPVQITDFTLNQLS